MGLGINDLKMGDVVAHWFDQGAGFGAALIYSRVLKVGAKKVHVRCENGDERWKYPHYFDKKISAEQVANLEINWN